MERIMQRTSDDNPIFSRVCREYYRGKDGRIYQRTRRFRVEWVTYFLGTRKFTGTKKLVVTSNARVTRRSDIIQRMNSV